MSQIQLLRHLKNLAKEPLPRNPKREVLEERQELEETIEECKNTRIECAELRVLSEIWGCLY